MRRLIELLIKRSKPLRVNSSNLEIDYTHLFIALKNRRPKGSAFEAKARLIKERGRSALKRPERL